MEEKKLVYIGIGILTIMFSIYFMHSYGLYKFDEKGQVKIFWINSYHSIKNAWTLDFINGFKEVFEEENIEIEIKQFEMDTLSFTSEESKESSGMRAKELIDEFEPDLIYATDDNSQEYVIEPYYLNSNIPVVFASVNKDISEYKYLDAKNVAGVLEEEHIEESFEFLKEIFPGTKKIVIISEPTDQWVRVLDKVEDYLKQSSEFELVERYEISTFEEFKEKILFNQNKTDAFFLTPISRFVDNQGNEIESEDEIKWLVKNSNIPEITLWPGVVKQGFFAAVVVSFYEEGRMSGEIAKEILIHGKKPANLEFQSIRGGKQMLNLARANSLGLKQEEIPSSILINSEVIISFPWEDEE